MLRFLRDPFLFRSFGVFRDGDEGGGAGGGSGSGGSGGQGGSGGGAGDGEGKKTFDEAYVKQLRSEAAANRKKADELEAKLKAHDDEKLSETDRLKKAAQEAADKAQAAEQKSRLRLAKAEVLAQATKANFHDADTAFALIKDRIEFDDEGEPKNVAALLEETAKEKPFLVKPEGGSGGQSGGSGGGSSTANPGGNRGGALSLDAIKKMSEAEINANWDRVQAALAAAR